MISLLKTILLTTLFGVLTACATPAKTLDIAFYNKDVTTTKEGFVNMTAAIRATTDGKKSKAILDKEYEALKAQLTAQSDEMTKKNFNVPASEIEAFKAQVAKRQQEIEFREKGLVAPILAKMAKAIAGVGKQKNFSKIYEVKDDSSPEGLENVTDAAVKEYESLK